ncbi:hypothetical protein PINS_up008506 [Pythium insidiosum]|nr:hypothetical protein PINS_up008506 [Pythium insidiosum]
MLMRRSLTSALRHCRSRRALHTTVRQVGQAETIDCRYVFHDAQGQQRSPWHDVPLVASPVHRNVFHFVNEIPKGSRAKLEIAGDEPFNPIKQDVKKGKPRFYHFDSLVNYGCLPQTWEDPSHVDASTGCGGDNDPVDVVEIGSRVAAVGEVYPVKVLGILGMIDDNETDWKVIAIDVNDPLAKELNDLEDLAKSPLSGVVTEIRDWFRDYKIPDGKPPSQFAFNGEAKSRDFAVDVIMQTHESWKQLVDGRLDSSTKLWTGRRPE